jgi:pilus assembly protein CpaF
LHLAELDSTAERPDSAAEALDRSLEGHDYGPLTPLLLDDSISEVMVNGPHQVYIERKGQLTLSDVKFSSDAELVRVIRDIAAFVGRRIDDDSPMVDCRLPDGSRVNAVIAPLALDGASLTIRKFARDPYTVEDLIKFGTLSVEAAAFLEACVKAHFNILVAGGTGSGKTTTLNVLSSFIPDTEPHKVRLESRPARIDGTGRISIRELVVNALRMRPDRIVIGECRSGEALDMLQAMNTGHDGSLTTIHANTPRDTLSRLETLVLMSGVDLPQRAIREQIASAIHLIVQQSRLRDGSRRMTNITEIVGREGDTITLQDVFLFEETGVDGNGRIQGKLSPTGIRPQAMAKIYSKRVAISPALAALFPDRKAPDFTLGVRR